MSVHVLLMSVCQQDFFLATFANEGFYHFVKDLQIPILEKAALQEENNM